MTFKEWIPTNIMKIKHKDYALKIVSYSLAGLRIKLKPVRITDGRDLMLTFPWPITYKCTPREDYLKVYGKDIEPIKEYYEKTMFMTVTGSDYYKEYEQAINTYPAPEEIYHFHVNLPPFAIDIIALPPFFRRRNLRIK